MPSIVNGIEYDAFISYRHKDDAYDSWVETFVTNLRKELAATVKEDISVYFDKNVQDGLHTHHQVNESLAQKINCLVFIPILSNAYCDPRSFAWQHEFIPFCELTRKDGIGMKINVANGNVSARILPINIRELDPDDISLYEKTSGLVLRSIDFTYRSAGINRPLLENENSLSDSQSRASYRDQINRVALAVKEITTAIRQNANASNKPTSSGPARRIVIYSIAAMAILLAVAVSIIKLGPFKDAKVTTTNSIAVLPFTNLSDNTDQEFFSIGITEQIITELAQLNHLKVIARTSVMQYKGTSKSVTDIGNELHVTHILEGSVRRYEDKVRITAQLIAVADQSHLWAADYDQDFKNILSIQDEVSKRIAKTLKAHLTPKEDSLFTSKPLQNPEAYEHYLKGNYIHDQLYLNNRQEKYFQEAVSELKRALLLEPDYPLAVAALADVYDSYMGVNYDQRSKYQPKRDSLIDLAFEMDPTSWYSLLVKSFKYYDYNDPSNDESDSVFHYLKLAYYTAPSNDKVCGQMGIFFQRRGLWLECIPLLEKSNRLDPLNVTRVAWLGWVYLQLGNDSLAKMNFKEVIRLNPNAVDGYSGMAIAYMNQDDVVKAKPYLDKAMAISADDYILKFAQALYSVSGGKKPPKDIFSHPYVLLKAGKYDDAMELVKNASDQYVFLKDNKAFDPLRSRDDFKKIMEMFRMRYEENKRKYKLEELQL